MFDVKQLVCGMTWYVESQNTYLLASETCEMLQFYLPSRPSPSIPLQFGNLQEDWEHNQKIIDTRVVETLIKTQLTECVRILYVFKDQCCMDLKTPAGFCSAHPSTCLFKSLATLASATDMCCSFQEQTYHWRELAQRYPKELGVRKCVSWENPYILPLFRLYFW